jgi:hypothetical protein
MNGDIVRRAGLPGSAAPRRPATGVLGGSLIVLGAVLIALAAGPGTGLAREPDPMTLLGATPDTIGCVTTPEAIGRGVDLACPGFTAVLVDGTVRVVSLYSGSDDGGAAGPYAGNLPEALEWREGLVDVADLLGQPRRITSMYGPPTLVYWFRDRPYQSLELQFNAAGELVRINASVTR